jgi:hypothetical protein
MNFFYIIFKNKSFYIIYFPCYAQPGRRVFGAAAEKKRPRKRAKKRIFPEGDSRFGLERGPGEEG